MCVYVNKTTQIHSQQIGPRSVISLLYWFLSSLLSLCRYCDVRYRMLCWRCYSENYFSQLCCIYNIQSVAQLIRTLMTMMVMVMVMVMLVMMMMMTTTTMSLLDILTQTHTTSCLTCAYVLSAYITGCGVTSCKPVLTCSKWRHVLWKRLFIWFHSTDFNSLSLITIVCHEMAADAFYIKDSRDDITTTKCSMKRGLCGMGFYYTQNECTSCNLGSVILVIFLSHVCKCAFEPPSSAVRLSIFQCWNSHKVYLFGCIHCHITFMDTVSLKTIKIEPAGFKLVWCYALTYISNNPLDFNGNVIDKRKPNFIFLVCHDKYFILA